MRRPFKSGRHPRIICVCEAACCLAVEAVAADRRRRLRELGFHYDRRRRIAGQPADFLKIVPGPILGPQGGQNRIPREKIFRFHPFS